MLREATPVRDILVNAKKNVIRIGPKKNRRSNTQDGNKKRNDRR